MSHLQEQPPRKDPVAKDARQKRLAAALRQNIARRKAQQQGRATGQQIPAKKKD